jgi:magnesium-transporting ATPase (P-type)
VLSLTSSAPHSLNRPQDEKPAGRQEPLINGKMFKHILAQGVYQLFFMFFSL